MKTLFGLFFGMLLTNALLGQQATNAPAPAPSRIETPAASPALTNQPPSATATGKQKASTKKTSAKPKAKAPTKKQPVSQPVSTSALRTVPLKPGLATVVASNVNVRGQAKLKSEVVARITRGQEVT